MCNCVKLLCYCPAVRLLGRSIKFSKHSMITVIFVLILAQTFIGILLSFRDLVIVFWVWVLHTRCSEIFDTTFLNKRFMFIAPVSVCVVTKFKFDYIDYIGWASIAWNFFELLLAFVVAWLFLKVFYPWFSHNSIWIWGY